jgi:hypothetical protein
MQIEFDKETKRFTIDDDVSTSLDDVKKRFAISQKQRGAKPAQFRWAYLVDQTVVHNVRVYIHPSVPYRWGTAVAQAIENWNAIPECNVVFRPIYTSAGANVTINTTALVNKPLVPANSDLPNVNGNPGQTVLLNTNSSTYNSTDAALLKTIITHELGHTIGLMHTNQFFDDPSSGDYNASVYHIPGTPRPGQDPNSIMNSVVNSSTTFTDGDLIAIRTLYPFTWDSWVERPWGDQDEGLGSIRVTWDNTVIGSTVKIEVYRPDNSLASVVNYAAANTGIYTFQPSDLADGEYYYIKVTANDNNSSHSDYSDNLFYYRTF